MCMHHMPGGQEMWEKPLNEESKRAKERMAIVTEEMKYHMARALPAKIFYVEKKYERECYCTRCGERYMAEHPQDIFHVKSGDYASCQECGVRGQAIRSNCKRKWNYLSDYANIVLTDVLENGDVTFRRYCVKGSYCKREAEVGGAECFVDYWEQSYIEARPGSSFRLDRCTGYYSQGDWVKVGEARQDGNRAVICGKLFGYGDTRGSCYIGLDKLKESFLKYVPERALHDYDEAAFCCLMAAFPSVEMLYKLDFKPMISKAIYCERSLASVCKLCGRNMKEVFPWATIEELRWWRECGMDLEALRYYRTLSKAFGRNKATMEDATSLARIYCSGCGSNFKGIIKRVVMTLKVRVSAVEKYFSDMQVSLRAAGRLQYNSYHEARRYWLDYMEAAIELGYDLSRRDVVLPADLDQLTARHDMAVSLRQFKIDEANAKKLREVVYKNRKKYEFRGEKYCMIVPESTQQIVDEGKAMRHCVGGYAERYAKGSVVILFLRRNSAPDKSFYTVQMDGVRCVQIHGKGNRETEEWDEVKAFFDTYLKKLQADAKNKKNKKKDIQEDVA